MGQSRTEALANGLLAGGVTVAATLPDTWVIPLIRAMDDHPDVAHVRVTREESAIALCAGVSFSGQNGVAIMGTSGFMASIYAITKICFTYEIGFPIVMSLRGVLGDFAGHHTSNGMYAIPTIEALNLPYEIVEDATRAERVAQLSVRQARVSKRPFLICLPSRLDTPGSN